MTEHQPVGREQALTDIPDSPKTLEFRAIALNPESVIYRSGDGLLLVDGHFPIVGVMGRVQFRDVEQLYRSRNIDWELIADRAARESLRDKIDFERASVFTLAGTWHDTAHQVDGLVIRWLEPGDSLAGVRGELRQELDLQRQIGPILAAFVRGNAVSFGYIRTTDTMADISIDTLAEHRRLGIATAVASALVDHCLAIGKAPVWGAVQSNEASLGLARKLGFTRLAGELFVAEEPMAGCK